jgi:hypothetical protein
MRTPAAALLAVALVSPTIARLAAADTSDAARTTTSPTANGAACAVRPVVRDVPKGAVLDTTWYRLGPAYRTCRIVNRRRTWVVECLWLYSKSGPSRIYSMEEAYRLHAVGFFNDSTLFTPMFYRYAVKAGSLEEARREAGKKHPVHAPRKVRDALLAEMAAATASSAVPASTP